MLNFAPDVYIMKYLSVSNQLMSDIAQKARQFMNAGMSVLCLFLMCSSEGFFAEI